MKKTLIAIVACCLILCTGCKKENFVSNTYKAYFEYHFADASEQQSVETLINSWSSVWTSEIELTLLDTKTTDAEAHTKFEASVTALALKANSWKPFFHGNDYMIYTLKRTTSGDEKILRQVQFDKDGHFTL